MAGELILITSCADGDVILRCRGIVCKSRIEACGRITRIDCFIAWTKYTDKVAKRICIELVLHLPEGLRNGSGIRFRVRCWRSSCPTGKSIWRLYLP